MTQSNLDPRIARLRLRFLRKNGRSTAVGSATSLLGAAVVMLLVWLGADPEAHEHFHADAGQDEHHCVITDFALGEGYYVAPRILAPPVGFVFETRSLPGEELFRESVEFALLPARGPPAFCASV